MTLKANWTRASWSWCWPMAKYKGKSQLPWVLCAHPVISNVSVAMPVLQSGLWHFDSWLALTVAVSVSHRKKGGRAASSNGDGRVSQFQPLLPSSALSDLDSEDELQIDESPPPRRRAPPNKKKLAGEVLDSSNTNCYWKVKPWIKISTRLCEKTILSDIFS